VIIRGILNGINPVLSPDGNGLDAADVYEGLPKFKKEVMLDFSSDNYAVFRAVALHNKVELEAVEGHLSLFSLLSHSDGGKPVSRVVLVVLPLASGSLWQAVTTLFHDVE
jgi:hypothetical protein